MTPELFQQYLEGLCNEEEKDQVERWLHTCTDEELDTLLQPRWTNNKTIMPASSSRLLWNELESAIGIQQPPAKVIGLAWYTRAAVVLLIAIAGWWMLSKKEAPRPVQVVEVQPVRPQPINDTITIFNNESHKKEIQLSDGSTVILNTNSRLQYKKDFAANRRDIYMEGKALFRVAKDKNRPFTVYSGAVSTTALGTVFTVNTLSDKHIAVKLLEGKVVVRYQQQETMLLPGQELTWHTLNHTSIVKYPIKPKPVPTATPSLQAKEIAFDNAPLPEVFDKLQQRYAAIIEYNKADVDNMYFTGTISAKDALPLVLKVIAQMNGLELKEQAKGYIIRPTSH